MKKSWYDRRADDGLEWAVVRVLVPEEITWAMSSTATWHQRKYKMMYYPCKVNKIHRRDVVGRNMTKKEAEAMAKLLGETDG